MRAVAGMIAAFAAANWSGAAMACVVCIELPEKTLAQRLLDADLAVFAREDPGRPFRFAPVQTLKGSAVGDDIPFLLDSQTRRRLAASAEDGVLLLRDDAGNWSRAGYADAALRTTAVRILTHGPSWDGDAAARFAFFEALLHHPDGDLRRLAMDEMARAPYGLIHGMVRPLDGPAVRRAMQRIEELPWRGVHLLMLGRSPRAEDHGLLRDLATAAARRGDDRHLAALATALIAADGVAAIDRLAREWLRPGPDAAAVRKVVRAFEAHAGVGAPALVAPLATHLKRVIDTRPDAAAAAARTLVILGDMEGAALIAEAELAAPDAWFANLVLDAAANPVRAAMLRTAILQENAAWR